MIEFQPFEFDDVTVVGAEIAPLRFAGFCAILREMAKRGDAPSAPEAAFLRERMFRQVSLVAKDGKKIALSEENIDNLPVRPSMKIAASLSGDDGGGGGRIVSDGDGIDTPIVYELGDPIKVRHDGKPVEIRQLSFQAQRYGDIERVLAAPADVLKAYELLANVAQPVGIGPLSRLPSFALDQVSIQDGNFVAQNIAPRFRE